MARKIRRVLAVGYALGILGALVLGANTALRASTGSCGGIPEEPGTCPPYNDTTCEQECQNREFFSGACDPDPDDRCCQCLAK